MLLPAMLLQRLQRLQPPAAKVGGIVYNMVRKAPVEPSCDSHTQPRIARPQLWQCCASLCRFLNDALKCIDLECLSLLSSRACLQVAPEPRSTGEGWGPYSASFRPHEVAVRRMVGDFSADWWARAQVSAAGGWATSPPCSSVGPACCGIGHAIADEGIVVENSEQRALQTHCCPSLQAAPEAFAATAAAGAQGEQERFVQGSVILMQVGQQCRLHCPARIRHFASRVHLDTAREGQLGWQKNTARLSKGPPALFQDFGKPGNLAAELGIPFCRWVAMLLPTCRKLRNRVLFSLPHAMHCLVPGVLLRP